MRSRSLLAAVLALLTVPGVAARGGMPTPLTERGQIIEGIYYPVYVAAVVAFLIVMALLIIVMVRFNAKNGTGRQTFEIERDNMKLEMTWIAIPLVVVLWVGVIGYAGLIELDEGIQEEDAWMEIKITGYQWTWEADYGSGISIFSDPSPTTGDVDPANAFVVPADRSIRFNVTGGDVIHAFHIMDANWATVGLVDANPYGPHKYNPITAELPEGEYMVQCREMCFNPGHGYMRATIKAVPMDEFQDWMEAQRLEADAALAQPVSLTWDGAAFDQESLTFVGGEGSRGIFTVSNDDSLNLTLDAGELQMMETVYSGAEGRPSVDLVAVDDVTVPAGETVSFAVETVPFGQFALTGNGVSVAMELIEAQAINVELGDYFITPMSIELEPGQTYLFQIANIGQTSHNFFVGEKESAGAEGITEWASATINGGQTTSLLITVDEAMTFNTWCNVPGHYDLGMFGTLTAA